jgi:hypothetical protein
MWPQSRYRGRQRVYLQSYLLESRVYSSKNLRSTVQKDFCNKIGTNAKVLTRITNVR